MGFNNGDLSREESAYDGGPLSLAPRSRSEPAESVGDNPRALFDMSGEGDRKGDGLRAEAGEGALLWLRWSILTRIESTQGQS